MGIGSIAMFMSFWDKDVRCVQTMSFVLSLDELNGISATREE